MASAPEASTTLTRRYSVALRSHPGLVRQNNEDAARAELLPDGTWAIAVADGMGSHRAGEVASRLAVDGVMEALLETPLPDTDEERLDRIVAAIRQAHLRIEAEGARDEQCYLMGTTVMVALLGPLGVVFQYAGDTRLYWLREGAILRRTRDQTAAQVLLELGRIREDELEEHPMAATLLSHIGAGVPWESLEVAPGPLEEATFVPQPGDVVVMCTDGVWGELRQTLVSLACQGGSAEARAARLLEAVLHGRAGDNATVAVVCVGGMDTELEVGVKRGEGLDSLGEAR